MKKIAAVFAIASLALTACGGGETEPTTETNATETTPEQVEETVPAVAEIVIEANDQMRYNLDRIDVKEGQKVRLTLKHVGTLPVTSMGHNWVLLATGTDKEAFSTAAIAAQDNGYIPTEAEFADAIIAHTDMIGGGEETTIEFDAPAKGFYPFICSFPGHHGFMKGTFYVN